MNGQNPELTAHLAYMEREMTRAYIVATMKWKCRKPTETFGQFVARKAQEGLISLQEARELADA